MKIKYHRLFKKHYQLRIGNSQNLKKRFAQRLKLFLENTGTEILKDHALSGKLISFRAFSVGGDLRVIYRLEGEVIELYDVGSHNQVY